MPKKRMQIICPLGLYLTDVTFCREGNPSHRFSPLLPEKRLINFNKYHKLARIVQGPPVRLCYPHETALNIDMQRFQYPYNLKGIPEVQQYLNIAFENAKHHGDLQDLYRRRCYHSHPYAFYSHKFVTVY